MSPASTVGPMCKVSLSLVPVQHTVTTSATPFEFIYGIGTEGISAFEQALYGKTAGDRLCVQVEGNTMSAYFERLLCPLMDALTTTPPFTLDIEIRAISPVSDRELVRALAQSTTGCDGDCGCGCHC
jgi:hypothetical protein